MRPSYHRKILHTLFQSIFSAHALREMVAANIRQDGLEGQLNHPEFHFDQSKFVEGQAYIDEQRHVIVQTLNACLSSSPKKTKPKAAWRAFGRLTHAAQDFYAHSNYVSLWLAQRGLQAGDIDPQEIDFLDKEILDSPGLRSGNFYPPLELLSFIPWFEPFVLPRLPKDSHAWMNLDYPGRGPLFPYALEAAVKRTRYEYHIIQQQLPSKAHALFTGSGYN